MTDGREELPAPHDEIDALVGEALRDDLPPDVEARLARRLDHFTSARPRSRTLPGWRLLDQWVVSQRTVLAAAALLLVCGISLQGSGGPPVLTESLSHLWASASLWRSIRTATSVTCTGLPRGERISPDALADRLHRRWVLAHVERTRDALISEFQALDEPARYLLVSDGPSQPPREIRKVLLPGASPAIPEYVARCAWEMPRAGPPGLALIVGR